MICGRQSCDCWIHWIGKAIEFGGAPLTFRLCPLSSERVVKCQPNDETSERFRYTLNGYRTLYLLARSSLFIDDSGLLPLSIKMAVQLRTVLVSRISQFSYLKIGFVQCRMLPRKKGQVDDDTHRLGSCPYQLLSYCSWGSLFSFFFFIKYILSSIRPVSFHLDNKAAGQNKKWVSERLGYQCPSLR